ncbi:MAG: DNA internalization-related competence protein ComEC/Rec2 [Endozoicomonas sp.]
MKTPLDLRTGVCSYVAGIAVVVLLPDLPPHWSVPLAAGLGVTLITAAFFNCNFLLAVGGFLLGLAIGINHGYDIRSKWLPENLEGQELTLIGSVAGLPSESGSLSRFDFRVSGWEGIEAEDSPRKLRLTWYGSPLLEPGQQWQMTVKLRHPHGNTSPGAFDLEAWAAREGIQATGYVKNGEWLSDKAGRLVDHRDQLRQLIRNWVADHVSADVSALLAALLVGDKSGISPEQWQLLNTTGTTHLMVISGLHIGLIATLGYWLVFGAGWLGLLPIKLIPRPRLAAIASLLAALTYAMLAGFSIPVQRALVMAAVAMTGPLFGIRPRASSLFLVALAGVLSIDPLAVTSVGFWYSFSAVAALLFGLSGRRGSVGLVEKLLAPQWVVFIILCPMLLYNQQSVSPVSPLINLVAIPLVGGVVVPLSLFSVLVAGVTEPAGIFLLQGAGTLLQWWMSVLQQLSQLSPTLPVLAGASPVGILLTVAGAFLWLLPQGVGLRWLTPFFLLPWLFPELSQPELGSAHVAVLDVGQGLSVLIRTSEHAMLYDTGDGVAGRFTQAERVILPYLRRQGVNSLDRIMISHGDRDHAGGLETIARGMPVSDVYAGSPVPDFQGHISACVPGQSWQWDGVDFEVLAGGQGGLRTNDCSCVLKVTANGRSFLLAGDIGKGVEASLLETGSPVESDILLVPHHGSKHSCSDAFLERVGADIALVSAGYRNRFGHPSVQALARIRKAGARVLNTADRGTLSFILGNGTLDVSGFRQKERRYWWR